VHLVQNKTGRSEVNYKTRKNKREERDKIGSFKKKGGTKGKLMRKTEPKTHDEGGGRAMWQKGWEEG